MPLQLESSRHETSFLVISKDEYDSMRETIEILSDKELMEQIRESDSAKKAGKVRNFEELAKELDI